MTTLDIGPTWLRLALRLGCTCCRVLTFHTPLVNVAFLTGVYAGRAFRVLPFEWGIDVVLAKGWYLCVSIGVRRADVAWWRTKRWLRKAGPEQTERMRDILRQLNDW